MKEIDIQILNSQDFNKYYYKYKNDVFEDDHSYVLWDILSETELSNVKRLQENLGEPFKLCLAAFDKEGNFLGWSWGYQESSTTFYMCNSAVLPQYRRQGIYGAILDKCLAILEAEGFQMVYSRHCATNNSVIIPKLKAGFLISKMELDDKFGVLIHLHHYFNEKRKKVMDYRAGQIRPDADIKKLFKI
ncbi:MULTISPECIES: GNAT family N-acetyltransferase [Halobacteriovorax]|uniref:N-acetyltransferase n=1 Tax=Halobacteriovorax vibrionivorans TaxID=2152716 RepID=A0ABY0II38_9BACT|nr:MULTISPECIES: GNAT family N-acetyltransferase [Halobacteriovorax]RZF22272.1 N-acetyltransferase [Halobacteriovorax vibrionivorans]TGD48524.1 N-acetyltransferase [Halobacteriovorax sp. Y22]